MAYNTTAIKTDVNGKPIPQYYDALHDEYRPLQGEHGASRAVLYGPDGQPLSTTDGKIDVRASELEALIGEVQESPSANTLLARLKTLADMLGTEATLQAVKIALDSLNTKDYATQATLAEVLSRLEAIEQRLDSGEAQVQLKGSNLALRQTIVTGAKTVTSTAAEIFAGSGRLAGRHAMVVTNTGNNTVYIGASNVSASNGFPVFPQDTIRIEFDPQSSVAVFAVSNGPNVEIRVVEMA